MQHGTGSKYGGQAPTYRRDTSAVDLCSQAVTRLRLITDMRRRRRQRLLRCGACVHTRGKTAYRRTSGVRLYYRVIHVTRHGEKAARQLHSAHNVSQSGALCDGTAPRAALYCMRVSAGLAKADVSLHTNGAGGSATCTQIWQCEPRDQSL